METLERFLAEHDFFAGLEPYYLHLLVGCASNVRFDRQTYLFREGEQADHFYLVRAGRVRNSSTSSHGPLSQGVAGAVKDRNGEEDQP